MYETEFFTDNTRRRLFSTVFTVFFICLGVFALSSVLSYFVMTRLYDGNAVFSLNSARCTLSELIIHRLPTLMLLLILLFSTFTHFTYCTVIIVAVWRGICTGVFVSAMVSGLILGIGKYNLMACTAMLVECAVIFVLSAFCIIYSEAVCVLRASGERTYATCISVELIRYASVLGGIALLSSAAAELLFFA